MTIEKMTILSYALLALAITLGMVTVVLFFTLKIPKAYRAVKGQKRSKKKKHMSSRKNDRKSRLETEKRKQEQMNETEMLMEEAVQFTILQDITYVHADEL